VLDQQRTGLPLDQSNHPFATGRTVDHSGRHVRSDQRSRHQGPPQLLEHDHRLGHAEPDPAGVLRQPQPEHPRLGKVAPERTIDTTARLQGPDPIHGYPLSAEVADSLLEGAFLRPEVEVHDGSFGNPRIRSATMFRWICDVPAAMEMDMA
jgi:hypothetical protein